MAPRAWGTVVPHSGTDGNWSAEKQVPAATHTCHLDHPADEEKGALPRDRRFQGKEEVQGSQNIRTPLYYIPVKRTATRPTVKISAALGTQSLAPTCPDH
ncbi:hypothetical protein PAL_GLEAN10014746 [Pteropus alecto]|uniref:Uncharacterized protein n=1 Tax=Pteropus alecto TaxID=9402 RepID=L5KNF8_PTEAL|nr:hypothetical protein PAL_GLEAN10014746 [Pteropus alecto]